MRRRRNESSPDGRIVGQFEIYHNHSAIQFPYRLKTGRDVDPAEQFVVHVDQPFKIRVAAGSPAELEPKVREALTCNGEVEWKQYALVNVDNEMWSCHEDRTARKIEFSWRVVWAGKVGRKWFWKRGEKDYIEEGRPDEDGKRGRTNCKSAGMILFTPEVEAKLNAIAKQFDRLHQMLYAALDGAALEKTLEQIGVPCLPAPKESKNG